MGRDTRTWRDLNGDDIAQENELGPSTNLNFGKPASVTRPDPAVSNGRISCCTAPACSRSCCPASRDPSTTTTASITTTSGWTTSSRPPPTTPRLSIPDPRGNGETITVYSIAPAKLGVIDNVRYNSTENGREYHGVDLSFNARLRNGTQLQGGVTTGKLHEHICQVDDPNNLRYLRRRVSVRDPVQIERHLSAAV